MIGEVNETILILLVQENIRNAAASEWSAFHMNHDSDEPREDLAHGPAIEKIRELVKSTHVCLFGTSPGHFPLTVRPMGVRDVDEAGNLWFLSGGSSLKNAHIAREPRVQLLFTSVSNSQYLSLEGFASISDLRA